MQYSQCKTSKTKRPVWLLTHSACACLAQRLQGCVNTRPKSRCVAWWVVQESPSADTGRDAAGVVTRFLPLQKLKVIYLGGNDKYDAVVLCADQTFEFTSIEILPTCISARELELERALQRQKCPFSARNISLQLLQLFGQVKHAQSSILICHGHDQICCAVAIGSVMTGFNFLHAYVN